MSDDSSTDQVEALDRLRETVAYAFINTSGGLEAPAMVDGLYAIANALNRVAIAIEKQES